MIVNVVIGLFLMLVGVVGIAVVLSPARKTNPVFLSLAGRFGDGGTRAIVVVSGFIAFFLGLATVVRHL